MTNRIVLNETSYFGRGSREKVAEEIKNRGYEKILVVTDRALIDANVAEMVTEVLDKAEIKYFVFDGVKPNPTVQNVHDGLRWLPWMETVEMVVTSVLILFVGLGELSSEIFRRVVGLLSLSNVYWWKKKARFYGRS